MHVCVFDIKICTPNYKFCLHSCLPLPMKLPNYTKVMCQSSSNPSAKSCLYKPVLVIFSRNKQNVFWILELDLRNMSLSISFDVFIYN